MQPQTTLTINEIINEITNEIINEIINEITNDKNEWQKEHSKHHMSYHLQLHMSKMKPQCQNSSKLCQKSSTNPQRWIFTSSRFMLSMTCCILLASMKVKCSIWTTHDFHEDRFCHQDFLWMTDFVTKILTPKLRHQNFDTKNFDTKKLRHLVNINFQK